MQKEVRAVSSGTVFMILFGAVLLIIGIILTFVLISSNSKDRELIAGANIIDAFVKGEKTAFISLESELNLSSINSITLVFTGEKNYTYKASEIKRSYQINASGIRLSSFRGIEGVSAKIEYQKPSVCTPNKDCSYYYGLNQCGSQLSDGCNNILNCDSCPNG
jgi:hypothetical protein